MIFINDLIDRERPKIERGWSWDEMGAGLLIQIRERPKIGTDFQIFDIAFWQTLGKGTPFKGLPSTPFKGGLNDLIESGFVNDKLPFIYHENVDVQILVLG